MWLKRITPLEFALDFVFNKERRKISIIHGLMEKYGLQKPWSVSSGRTMVFMSAAVNQRDKVLFWTEKFIM